MIIDPTLHLRITGIAMLLLVLLNLGLPRRLKWNQELASLTLLNRQIFQVHAAFICVILLMFAGLALLLTRQLLEPTALARAVLASVGAFWLLRLLTQWFVYDPRIWRGHRFYTVMHVFFSGLWIYFVATFAYALYHNLGAH